MNLAPAYCPECHLYLGLQDASGEIPKTFLMPHIPGCRIGDREREAIKEEMERGQRQR